MTLWGEPSESVVSMTHINANAMPTNDTDHHYS